ncbi:hypothetical protein INR49_001870 [Caranx melampygus]|nr:hypothetical protein INR49_001870 [Caranx melampygus]
MKVSNVTDASELEKLLRFNIIQSDNVTSGTTPSPPHYISSSSSSFFQSSSPVAIALIRHCKSAAVGRVRRFGAD